MLGLKGENFMFLKVVVYSLLCLVIIVLLGKINYNTSLYTKQDNAVEFIFPRWNWGDPMFYLFVDADGFSIQKPDDLHYRYCLDELELANQKKEKFCAEKGMDSQECLLEEGNVQSLEDKAQEAKEQLEALKDEKGKDLKLSREYKKQEFQF